MLKLQMEGSKKLIKRKTILPQEMKVLEEGMTLVRRKHKVNNGYKWF